MNKSKATAFILISLSLGLLVGVGIRAFLSEVTPNRVINVPTQVIMGDAGLLSPSFEEPFSRVQTTAEVVISVPKTRALKTAPAKEEERILVWECDAGGHESQVGGAYRKCEWK